MNGIIIQILFIIISYLIGSIPWALITGKLIKGIDIRQYGSKNMGATNTFRVLGFKWGLLVFLLDSLKGGLILLLMKYNVFGFDYQNFPIVFNPLFYGIAAFLGHLFPIFARFKGGKGMATATGIVFAYSPIVFLVGLITFIIVILLTRFVSLSSCVTCIACLVTSLLLKDKDLYLIVILILLNLFIIIKHIPNFKRIINHTESKINFKSIKDESLPAFYTEDEEKELKEKENKDVK